MCNHTDSIDLQKYKNVYFIGIGGSSMSSLAMILKRRGCVVRGYDRAHTRETEMLQNSGIPVYDTTDASHFDGAELIVYTVAFAPDHPEMVLAAQRGVPVIPRIISEMAHSATGIDIHPGAKIGHHFSIDHGTGTVIGETSVIGNYVRIFQGVSLAGEKLPPDENGNAIRGVARHPILEDHVTVYSNSTLIGKIRIGRGATICGNVWIAEDVPAGSTVTQLKIEN